MDVWKKSSKMYMSQATCERCFQGHRRLSVAAILWKKKLQNRFYSTSNMQRSKQIVNTHTKSVFVLLSFKRYSKISFSWDCSFTGLHKWERISSNNREEDRDHEWNLMVKKNGYVVFSWDIHGSAGNIGLLVLHRLVTPSAPFLQAGFWNDI